MPTSILDLLEHPGDLVEGILVETRPSEEIPDQSGVLVIDTAGGTLEVDLDTDDDLRREVDSILDAHFHEQPGSTPFIRIVLDEARSVQRPDKDFVPAHAYAVILNPEGVAA